MAEAFARMHGAGVIEPVSAGSRPSAQVNPRAIAAMQGRGYDLGRHVPKSLQDVGPGPWDYIITLGCGDECPWVPAAHKEIWDLPDPRDMPPTEMNALRDEIELRVIELIERVRSMRELDQEPTDSASRCR